MAALLILYFGVTAIVVAVAWSIARLRDAGSTRGVPASAELAVTAARRRALVSVGFSAVVFAACIALPFGVGMPQAVAPALSASAGLLLYAATPPRDPGRHTDAPRTASLEPRHVWTFAPLRESVALGVLTLALIAVLVLGGVTASDDDLGRSRAIAFVERDVSTISTPYPGWYYTGPLLAATAVLVGAVYLALRRVSSTRSLPGAMNRDVDARWRAASARVVLATAGAAILFGLGAVLAVGGSTAASAFDAAPAPHWVFVTARAATALGLIAVAASIAAFSLAAARAATLRTTALGDPASHRPIGAARRHAVRS